MEVGRKAAKAVRVGKGQTLYQSGMLGKRI